MDLSKLLKPSDRRLKRFLLSPERVLSLFQSPRCDYLYRLWFEGVPDDAELLDVNYSWECRAFGFLLRHPSFAEVPDGEMIPSVSCRDIVVRNSGPTVAALCMDAAERLLALGERAENGLVGRLVAAALEMDPALKAKRQEEASSGDSDVAALAEAAGCADAPAHVVVLEDAES